MGFIINLELKEKNQDYWYLENTYEISIIYRLPDPNGINPTITQKKFLEMVLPKIENILKKVEKNGM